MVPAKTLTRNFDCKCPRKCPEKFTSEAVLQTFFSSFWKLGSYSQQNVFLRGLVQSSKCARSRPRDGTGYRKTTVFHYFIHDKGENVRVCKKYFLGLLKISWGRLYRCLTKDEVFGVLDGRGKNISSNKIDDTDVVAHIQSFPSYQSHYTRKDSDRKYLHPDLNIRKMYDLYVEKCTQENKQPVKEKYYYHVFSSKFNLHFKVPSKDTCRLCDELHMKLETVNDEEKKKLKLQKELHLARAEKARQVLKDDSECVSEDTYVCTFDLQKALPFPKLSTSVAYYKRNMYMYNFGIHSFNDSISYMYVWDETEGGRGSQDLSSCVQKHLRENASTYKNIIMFSDSCTGQNRNIIMSLTMLKYAQDPNMSANIIDLKFLVSGHSYLPNDTDFGVIERKSKKQQQIFVPEDWMNVIRTAKHKKPQFKVISMHRMEFLSTGTLEKAVCNRKKDTEGNSVNWLQMRWLRFEKGSPFTMKFKETFNDIVEFRQIDLRKYGPGRNVQSLVNVEQVPLYPSRRPISEAKKK